jgi:hypothetical protein
MVALKEYAFSCILKCCESHGLNMELETMTHIYNSTQGTNDALRRLLTMASIGAHLLSPLPEAAVNIVATNEPMAWYIGLQLTRVTKPTESSPTCNPEPQD